MSAPRLAAALAVLAALLIAPAIRPAPARGGAALPACRYADVLTTPRGYGDWPITLVDTILRVPKDYVPPDLVRVVDLGVPGRNKVRAVMAGDLKAMSDAAAAANAPIAVQSGYRSYDRQKAVFDSWVATFGYARALEVSARPGHSEHQLGLAIDVRSEPADDLELATQWAGTPAGKWMRTHAWEYGFVMSYPKGTMAVTCYDWEPWHFRYVGKELAALIHASGLTIREYLWANFTTAVVPPAPVPSHKPAATAVPTLAPTPAATSTPLPSATPPSPTATAIASSPPPAPTPEPTPAAAPPTGPANAALDGLVVVAGVGALLAILVLAGWLGLRRGRSGVGL